MRAVLLLLLLIGCEADPDPCAPMCVAAARLQGACLEAQGLDWAAAGHADEQAFLESCETWAWEMRLLEEDAVERGVLEQAGVVDRVCAQRAERLSGEDASCEDYAEIDWNALPWE